MNKIVPVLLVVLLLGVGGYFFLANRPSTPQSSQIGQPAAQTQQGSGVIESIKDALAKSMSLKCEYPDEKGNTVVTYVKGDNVRVEGYTSSPDAGQGNALIKGNTMYMWDDTTKKGTTFTFDPSEAGQTAQKMNQKAETLENLEKYKDYCKAESVSDSLFTVHSDVQFTDFQKQMEQSGVDLEKLMQQYQTTPPAQE